MHGKWIPFGKIETKSVIQKRELESGVVIPPVEEKHPAPVIELVEELENLDTASAFSRFQQPGLSLNRTPLTRSIEPGLNTNIQGSVPPMAGEFYGGLPPRPIGPIPAEPLPVPVVPVPEKEIVPPPNSPVIVPLLDQNTPEEVPPPALGKTRLRQYAVYAGDVILKYLSQFFNRARITYNRFTAPPQPTPVYEN